jgi:peptidyl-Lys metalloendopeptidase
MAQGDSTLGLLGGLEFSKRVYQSAPRNALVFSLTNQSRRTLSVLKWHTPLEGFKSDTLEVRRAGKLVPYVGRLYKRAAPTPEDYVTIRPGQTVRQSVDFFDAYDVAERGTYRVQYRIRSLHAGSAGPAAMAKRFVTDRRQPLVAVRANTAIFALTRSRRSKFASIALSASKRKSKKHAKKARKVAFDSCSDKQQTMLQNALDAAVQLANAARDALVDQASWARPNAPRYREWFGDYDSSRYDKVRHHYSKIADALANKDVKFFCDCSSGDFAYVYPWMAYHVHLCTAFWNALPTGTDSQAGTLIHETSHFWAVASTNDHTYGQPNCRTLAIDHPDDAVDNADTHEYFAENNPALSMDPAPGSIIRITDLWHNMPSGFSGGFDAVLNGDGPFSGKCYFFKGNSYVRYDWSSDRADSGYPKNIAANWHNMPGGFTGDFDAAVNGQGSFSGKCYFFKGASYVRYDWGADRADSGYPKSIAANWNTMPAGFTDNLDAIINGGGRFAGKCYFFKGDSYVRYDWNADRADPGYPRNTSDNWHCLPAGFTGSYSDALEGDRSFSGKGYFFKGDFYVRYNWDRDCAEL